MKYYINNLYLLVIALFINAIVPIYSKTSSKNDENKEQFYLIYVNNTLGEYKVHYDSKNKNVKREESQIYIESLVDKINTLIIDNKDTYEDREKLDEIEKISQLNKKKRSEENQEFTTYDESDFVFPISSINHRVVLYAYLSPELVKKVKKMDKNIFECEPDQPAFTLNAYYNEKEILAETGWDELRVQENASPHLSLISQGKYDKHLVNKYDKNYYYPRSAGKDIDIIIMDVDFSFDYYEFNKKPDGEFGCVAVVKNGKASNARKSSKCGSDSVDHGRHVSDLAGGNLFGVAKKANIYGVALPLSDGKKVENSVILVGLQYVHDYLIRPHKTIINMSLGTVTGINSSYHQQLKELIDSITKKGGIVVASSDNTNTNIDEYAKSDQIYIPCGLNNVICVGGINNDEGISMEKVYVKDSASDYGSNVKIYAPIYAETDILVNGKVAQLYVGGTSYSTPLVAGIMATIMSENSSVKYTKKTIFNELIKNGKSETIMVNNETCYLANNGKHIVYSRDKKYDGCGIHAGNIPCECGPGYGSCGNGKCCSPYGYCGTTTRHCGTGCQANYGLCNSSGSGSGTSSGSVPISMIEDRCGPEYGACADPNACCSEHGWCDTTSKHCGTGCQPKYGKCNSSGTSSGSTETVPVSTVKDRCGPEYGACADRNACCSKYGWCDTTSEYCGTGCQPKYGLCH